MKEPMVSMIVLVGSVAAYFGVIKLAAYLGAKKEKEEDEE